MSTSHLHSSCATLSRRGLTFMGLRSKSAGFTLVETVMSVAILSVFVAFAYAALLISNRKAMVNRLYTLAEERARDQIDRVSAAAPYNPQFTAPLGPQIPTDLILDSARGGPDVQSVPLYVEPTSGATVVSATVTTSITDTATLNTRAALVTVSYSFLGRPYTVKMNTLRTSDS